MHKFSLPGIISAMKLLRTKLKDRKKFNILKLFRVGGQDDEPVL